MTPSDPPAQTQKTVRSFVRREGRLTRGQQRALDELWPRFGVEYDGNVVDLDAVFQRRAPRVLEIGTGNGEALTTMAAAMPEHDFLGVEVHRPGVGHALLCIERLALTNVRLLCHDAVEVVQRALAPGSLQRVHIYFPDPWPKKRHHKRRLIQPPFLDMLTRVLAPGGVLHLATDWENYAEQMLEVLTAHPAFTNQATPPGATNVAGDSSHAACDLTTGTVPRPDERPLTKFEQRGHRHGHNVWDLKFTHTPP